MLTATALMQSLPGKRKSRTVNRPGLILQATLRGVYSFFAPALRAHKGMSLVRL